MRVILLAWAAFALVIRVDGFGWGTAILGGLVVLLGVLAVGRVITR